MNKGEMWIESIKTKDTRLVLVKKDFTPRVTNGTILHQHNLEYIMGQFLTNTTLILL